MPTASFSKDITSIFNNNEIRDELKYDIACRLLSETLDVMSVSMLIYNAKEDRLKCRGNHINLKNEADCQTEDPDLRLIINHISVFDFFNTQRYDSFESTTLPMFLNSIICGNSFAEKRITESEFIDLKILWKEQRIRDLYTHYKKVIHTESYAVSNDSISGEFFKKLLHYKNKLVNDITVCSLREGPQKGRFFFDTWATMNISFKEENLYYIGLPLFATERYSGILRLIVSSSSTSFVKHLVTKIPVAAEIKSAQERLVNFAQLLSLHLKTDYYLAGYRAFSNLKMDINDNYKIDAKELRSVCNLLASVINCNGCIIRFNEKKGSKNPPIRATSDSLQEYHKYVTNDVNSKFSRGIYKVLTTPNKLGHAIRAVNFSVDRVDSDRFHTREYYYDQNANLQFDEVEDRHFDDFTPAYNKKLFEFNMREVLVLPIDNVTDGIIILTNTAHRLFTNADVDMILLASKKIQLEIKILQELEQKEQNKLMEAQLVGMNIVLHQFGQIIKSSNDVMAEVSDRTAHLTGLLSGRDDGELAEAFDKLLPCLQLLGFLTTHSQTQIRRADRINKIDSEALKPVIRPIYDFNSFLRNKCKDFEPYANVERGLHIWLLNSRETIRVDTDDELFTEVVYSLLDNAVKYSFDAPEMKSKGIAFDPLSYKSEGNILVSYSTTLTSIEIKFTSWGPTILPGEKETIFERSSRGSNSKEVIGTGIGLYLCRKVMTALNGKIVVETSKNKTTFLLTLNK